MQVTRGRKARRKNFKCAGIYQLLLRAIMKFMMRRKIRSKTKMLGRCIYGCRPGFMIPLRLLRYLSVIDGLNVTKADLFPLASKGEAVNVIRVGKGWEGEYFHGLSSNVAGVRLI